VEAGRDSERVFAADRDEGLKLDRREVLEHSLDAALDLVRVRPRGAEDRPAAREQPRDLPVPERRVVLPLDESAPALPDADDVPAAVERAPRDRPDDRVQTGAVAAARQDSDPARHRAHSRGSVSAPCFGPVTGPVPSAEGGNRTHTARRPPDFESGASTSSATSA